MPSISAILTTLVSLLLLATAQVSPPVLDVSHPDRLPSSLYLPYIVRSLPPVEMVTIPAGGFRMGCSSTDPDCHSNELPLHSVHLYALRDR